MVPSYAMRKSQDQATGHRGRAYMVVGNHERRDHEGTI
jgi:hypothetical protein